MCSAVRINQIRDYLPLILCCIPSDYDMEQIGKKIHFDTLSDSERKTRLEQLLGLPPTADNDLFCEFWVREGDVFRPTIDSTLNFSYAGT